MNRRRYLTSGVEMDSQGFRDEEYRFAHNTRWFRSQEEADAYRGRRNAVKRMRLNGFEPQTFDEVVDYVDYEDTTYPEWLEMRNAQDCLLAIRQLIEDGTSVSQFSIKVSQLLEENE